MSTQPQTAPLAAPAAFDESSRLVPIVQSEIYAPRPRRPRSDRRNKARRGAALRAKADAVRQLALSLLDGSADCGLCELARRHGISKQRLQKAADTMADRCGFRRSRRVSLEVRLRLAAKQRERWKERAAAKLQSATANLNSGKLS